MKMDRKARDMPENTRATFDQMGLRRVAARLLVLDNPGSRQAAERLIGRRLAPYGLDAATMDEEITRYFTTRH
jgi:hypothetical protein